VKDSGHGVQGHTRSPVENATGLLLIHEMRSRLGISFNAAVSLTAAGQLTSPSTLRRASSTFNETGTLPVPSTAHRGSGNPNHPRNTTKLGLAGELILHQLLHTVRESNTQETITTLRAGLHSHGYDVSRTTVFRTLHALTYRFTNKRFIGATTFETLHNR
jgi:hypothetical protein